MARLIEDDGRPFAYDNIHESVANEDVADLVRHIKRGARVNNADDAGDTALHIAANKPDYSEASIKMVSVLLAYDADPKQVNPSNMFTPLHAAAQFGNTLVATALVEHGAGIDERQRSGWTALHMAVSSGFTALARQLTFEGADVNLATPEGETALHIAAKRGNLEVAKALIAQHANVNAMDLAGESPLHHLAIGWSQVSGPPQKQFSELAKLLVESGADINKSTGARIRPIHYAAKCQSAGAIEALWKLGAEIDGRTADGMSPLHYAAYAGSLESAQFLVERGIDINAQSSDGSSPLHIACSESGWYYRVAELLLQSGADANLRANDGMTPLHLASLALFPSSAKLLIKQGADASANDKLGGTALHYLVMGMRVAGGGYKVREFEEIMSLLLESGADLSARAKNAPEPLEETMKDTYPWPRNGYTPEELAAAIGRSDIAELLRNAQSSAPEQVSEAS